MSDTLQLHQANERTMLAWTRTGIALMAFGFAIARFGLFLRQLAFAGAFVERHPHGLGSAWLGSTLVALGMLANLFATLRYASVRRAIDEGRSSAPSPTLVYVMGGVTTAVGLGLVILLAINLGE